MNSLAVVASFHKVIDAELARLALEEAGIQAFVEDAHLVTTAPLLSNAVGGIRLTVQTADVARAGQVLADLRVSAPRGIREVMRTGQITLVCPECGQIAEFPATQAGSCQLCPRCREYVDVPEPGREAEAGETEPPVVEDATGEELGDASLAARSSIGPASTSEAKAVGEIPRPAETPVAPGLTWREGWLAVLVVLSVHWVPSLYTGLGAAHRHTPAELVAQLADSSAGLDQLVSSYSLIVVVLYLAWRPSDRWRSVGILPIRWGWDVAAGLVCLAAQLLAEQTAWILASHQAWRYSPLLCAGTVAVTSDTVLSSPQSELPITPLVLLATIAAAFHEELIYRGFLISRLTWLLGSAAPAILVAATLFAIPHFIWGTPYVFTSWITGVVLGMVFHYTGRLWPTTLAHALHNYLVLLAWQAE